MGDVTCSQIALTYLLAISGLVLVILLRPPVRGFTPMGVRGEERSGDWRPTALVLVLLILVIVAASLLLADDLVGLRPLQQAADYAIVGLAVLAWASAAILLWRVRPLGHLWQRIRLTLDRTDRSRANLLVYPTELLPWPERAAPSRNARFV
jgi:hypothetical protein